MPAVETLTSAERIVMQGALKVDPLLTASASPANLGKFANRMQRLLNGDDVSLRINLLGDSHTLSVGGTYHRNSLAAWMAKHYERLGLATTANKFGMHSSAAATATYDPRHSFTGTVAGWQDLPGGKAFRLTSAGAQHKYTPGVSWKACNFLWFRDTSGNGGGGDMTITLNGGATQFSTPTSGGLVSTQTISQSGAASLQTLVITAATAGAHTIEVTNGATGNIQTYGFECYDPAVPTVFLRTLGYSGVTSANMVANSIPVRIYEAPLTCDLWYFSIGANDANTSVALATYAANLTTLKNSMLTLGTASIVAWTWPPASAGTAALAAQQTYADQFITSMGNNVVLFDLFNYFNALGGQAALALNAGGLYKDALHLGAYGCERLADGLFKAAHNRVPW